MKRHLIASVTLMALSFGSYPAYAQSDAIQEELVKGANFAQASNADGAEKAFQKAYDGASAINDQARMCQAALQLAIVKTGLHKTADAEKLFQVALEIGHRAMPGNTAFMAVVNCLLADLFLTENRPAEAEKLYLIGIPALPANPPTLVAEKTINLAHCYERADKLQLAQEAFEKGLAIYNSAAGADNAETMRATSNYAAFQFDSDNDAKALSLAQRVLQSKTAAKDTRAVADNVLANVYNRQEEYGKAMHIAQKSYDEFKNSQSTDLVAESTALLLIGRIYTDGHRYRQAQVVIEKALAILAKADPDGTNYADALREKGVLFTWQGQYEKAEDAIKKSKAIREKFLGSETSDTAQNCADLGYIYQQENKFADAESNYLNALRLYKKTRSEKYVHYVETLAKLADLYKLMGRKGDAETTLNSVIDLRRSTLAANSPKITRAIVSLANLYKDDNQAAKAAKLLLSAVGGEQPSNADPAQQAGLLQDLAQIQAAAGNKEQAAQTNKKAEALMGTLFGAYKTSSSEPAVAASSSEKSPTGEKWCLCVGISNFKDTSINLKYSAKDATDFKNFLISKGHFKPDHVKLLVDESATRQNLIDQLGDGWLASHVKPDDLVMVYISSHGSQALDEANGVNFLVTYDTNKSSLLATGIPMQWLSKIIAEQVKCQRTVIMLDVCHSGSAADWSDESLAMGTSSGASVGTAANSGGKGLARMLTSDPQSVVPGVGQVIMCSSAKSQTSWESEEYPNGVFTKRLMDALNANGPATKLGDAYSALKTSVEGEVLRDRGQLQTPQISGSGKISSLSPLK